MPLKNCPELWIPDSNRWTVSQFTFGMSSGKKQAYIFQVPKTGNISHVLVSIGSVTSAQLCAITIQTVDGTTGNPSGSNYGGCVKGTFTPSANTSFEVALGTPAAATVGDVVAVVVEFDSTAGTHNMNAPLSSPRAIFPYVAESVSGTYTKFDRFPQVGIKYDDGTYPDMMGMGASQLTSNSYNSGSNPDERALKFKLPFPCRIKGAYLYTSAGTSADFSIVLYDTDGTTALATVAVDATDLRVTTSEIAVFNFNSPVVLKRNQYYRLSLKPTTANNVTMVVAAFLSAAVLDSQAGGQNFHLSTRVDAGAWTDTTASRPMIGLRLDQIHDGQVSDYLPV